MRIAVIEYRVRRVSDGAVLSYHSGPQAAAVEHARCAFGDLATVERLPAPMTLREAYIEARSMEQVAA